MQFTSVLVAWSLYVSINAYSLEEPRLVLSQASQIHSHGISGDSSTHRGVRGHQDGLSDLATGGTLLDGFPRGILVSKRDTSFEDLDMINLVRRKKKEHSPEDKKKEADKKAKEEADKKQKKEADAKKKEQEKANKKKKDDEKANKRAKDNHASELKANQKSADKHIKEVNKTGDWLAKKTSKQERKASKKESKEKGKLEKAEKDLAAASKPGAGGKKHDKKLHKAEKEVSKAKSHLSKTESKDKQKLEKLNAKADKKVNKSKQGMFDDWKKNNKDQWKVTQDGIAEAIKHPSKAKQIGMKILKAFEWIGTAALSIIPGLGAAMAAGVTAAKTVAQVAMKEGVKAGVKAGVKKGAREGAKKVLDGKEKQNGGGSGDGTSTHTMNSAQDDKKAGVETNAMKTEIQNQQAGLTGQMDAAISKAKAKGAKVRRALEDLGVWDEVLGLEMWKRCMMVDEDEEGPSVVMRRVVDVSVRREMERRVLNTWEEREMWF